MRNRLNLKVGDYVTCSARRAEYIFKVTSLEMETWTAQQAQWGNCTLAEVGTQYLSKVKLKSVYELTIKPSRLKRKQRAVGLTTYPDWCELVDPQAIHDTLQNLDKFLTETFV